MLIRSRFTALTACSLLLVAMTTAAALAQPPAQESSPAYARWQSTLAAFARADREQLPGTGGVLFTGSSTIRMWHDLRQDFRQLPVVINRGFGGSTMADCSVFYRELVTRYKPAQVLVYAGDNDLAEGRTPAQVLDSFSRFVRGVRSELPDVRIAYISIKPSPSRAALLPEISQTNALIKDYLRALPDTRYIDIFSPMLDEQSQPRPELFLPDKLHLNAAGYDLWQAIIAAQLSSPGQPPPPASAAPAL